MKSLRLRLRPCVNQPIFISTTNVKSDNVHPVTQRVDCSRSWALVNPQDFMISATNASDSTSLVSSMSTTGYVPPPNQAATQHEGTSSLAINNIFPCRFMTLVALKASTRFYKPDGPCIPISKSLIVKKGPFVHLTEAATMQFIAANTSIPVPTVHYSFVYKNRVYIVMQRIRGTCLTEAWRTLSEADLVSIFAQLRRMLEELRALVPPNGVGVESCTGVSLRDSRIPRSRPRFEPFKTIRDFGWWLREDLEPGSRPDRIDDQD
ncbi:serine threonine kinase [Fusarium acutatum]|uniref:Serine threonine kinase n=1 Tax=Fusarium acutatum TaxID=78861 RepID=A0A8H4NFB5_9HYPO|nr:serine threonine kinase [Fusarium acutatum]